MIARVAGTLILPYEVHTAAIGTEVPAQFTLIDVNTCRDVWGQLMTRWAFAAVTAFCIKANTASAEEWISLTLINIHAVLHHHESTLIAFITLAFKVPWGVHTLASATEVGRYAAFINICAVPFFRIKSKATVTPALEAANGISALAMGAEAGYHLALIDIFEERFSICNIFRSKSWSSGAELLILWGVSHGTLLTLFRAPGSTYRAAAGIHAVASSNRQSALLIIIPQVTCF